METEYCFKAEKYNNEIKLSVVFCTLKVGVGYDTFFVCLNGCRDPPFINLI